jgi:serine/threonine protein kinase
VYALGAILYEMLTGRPPFKGVSTAETLAMIEAIDPVPPRRLQPGISRDLETICLKCLQKEAGKRYRTADELADDLDRSLDGTPILACPIGRPERVVRWVRSRPSEAGLLAGLMSVALLGLISVLWQWRSAFVQRRRAELSEADACLAQERTAAALEVAEDSEYFNLIARAQI